MNLSALNTATEGKTRTTGVSPFSELELSKVYANPAQPRKNFENIEELSQSILENGLIQPISVVKKQDGYMIIGGERRYRASLYAGLKTIKAHVLHVDDKKVLELSLIENIQREDLTDFEKAQFINTLWQSGHYAQKQDLATAIGKSQSYISKALGTLKLDVAIMTDMQEQKHDIGLSVLEEISRVADKEVQKEVYELIIKKEITRDEIKNFKQKTVAKKKIICYGFGTQVSNASFITISKGEITGTMEIRTGAELIKQSSNFNYKITIEEI